MENIVSLVNGEPLMSLYLILICGRQILMLGDTVEFLSERYRKQILLVVTVCMCMVVSLQALQAVLI